MALIVGTAGWTIPRHYAGSFPAAGSSLERYVGRFAGVEINSSFHRPHRASTWSRWAASVPDGFAFSVKLPREISHVRKLVDCREPLLRFLDEAAGLGEKLSVLLLQLPPKLAFDAAVAGPFLDLLAGASLAQIVCEPRHPSWFEPVPDQFLRERKVARVAADPPPAGGDGVPGGWPGFRYWRLHGSPRIYRSSYDDERLAALACAMDAEVRRGRPVWCIFDNTAGSAAAGDALRLEALAGNLGTSGIAP